MSKKGTLIAAMAAGFFATATPLVAQADGHEVRCSGVNECKGKGGCKGADNGCSGKNGCKGKGWVMMSEKDCKDKGGKIVPSKKK